jgi:very-short-patch-repair endonuclease
MPQSNIPSATRNRCVVCRRTPNKNCGESCEFKIQGFHFRRQAPVGPFIADFIWLGGKLVVEVDGGQHALQKAQDELRTAWLRTQGYSVLRFWNHDVLARCDDVAEEILRVAKAADGDRKTPPDPSPQGGGEINARRLQTKNSGAA